MNEKPHPEPDPKIWGAALSGMDFLLTGNTKGGEYPHIPEEEIERIEGVDQIRGDLMRLVNETSGDIKARVEGGKKREKKYHEFGWQVSIETPQGIVGLWSCWLGDRFYLGFPKNIEIPDKLIMDSLGLQLSADVGRLGDFSVSRLWAKFCGRREKEGGRVWVDFNKDSSDMHHFDYINGEGQIQTAHYGYNQSSNIDTFHYSEFDENNPDNPTGHRDTVQQYRDGFLLLAAKIAFLMGGVKAVDIGFETVSLVPEDLYNEGYNNVEWVKGEMGERKGWGNEIVRAKKGDSTVILKSGNSLVPWVTILKAPVGNISSPEILADFINSDLLYF